MRQKKGFDWKEEEVFGVSGFEDDGEAAFWDEFNYLSEESEMELFGERDYVVKVVDEDSGEERVYEGVRLVAEVRRGD